MGSLLICIYMSQLEWLEIPVQTQTFFWHLFLTVDFVAQELIEWKKEEK